MIVKRSRISVLIFVTAISGPVFTLPAFCAFFFDKSVECAGKVDNGLLIFREFPAFRFSGQQLKITGSDIFSTYNFVVCSENGKKVFFTTEQTECQTGVGTKAPARSARGTFDQNTGQINITGSQGMQGEYHCKEIIKK